MAVRFTEGYSAAAPLLTQALDAVRALEDGSEDVGRVLWLVGNRAGGLVAVEAWDFDAARALASR